MIARLAIACVLVLLLQTISIAEEAGDACVQEANESDALLHCVAELVKSNSSPLDARVLLKEPIRGLLKKLEGSVGYKGSVSDLDVLKGASLNLKKDSATNRDAISVLDGAVASHAAELRPAMSRETAASNAVIGTDIYPRFVEQRLTFLLKPENIEFYKRGPFEFALYSSLASALESKYFLLKSDWDDNLLRREIQALESAHAMLPELPATEKQRRSRLNGNLFWQASIFFAMGEKEKFVQILHNLIYDNRDFGIENKDSGHIYVYRAFNFPFSIVVEESASDGRPVLSGDDPHVIDRFYNPGHLAMAACDLAEVSGHGGIKTLSDTVRDLSFRDFYVVAASGNEPVSLQLFGDQLLKSIQQGEFGARRDMLHQEILRKAAQLSPGIKNGAANCGIAAEVRERFYPPFDFKFQVRHIENFGKHTEHLMMGGSLDADLANKLAELLNSAISADQSIRDQARSRGIESAPYSARVRIE